MTQQCPTVPLDPRMVKILLWIVGVILVIGLLIVFGVLDFIF